MSEETILLIAGFISGSLVTFASGYLLTLISDKRKYNIEKEKELRLAYARWFSLQRMAFHRVTLLFESMLVGSSILPLKDLRQPVSNVQEELKEFQTILSSLIQNAGEISLLETKDNRLKTIKSLDEDLNKFYYLLLRSIRTRKAQVEHFAELDEMEASIAKVQTDGEVGETVAKFGEDLKKIRAKNYPGHAERFLEFQDSIKQLTEHMEQIDTKIRKFFHSLEGKV